MSEEKFSKNIKLINSKFFNIFLESKSKSEEKERNHFFLINEKLYRLYNLACKKLGLEYDEKFESEELTKDEQDHLMSEELDYLDNFDKIMDEKFDIEYGTENLKFLKRYLVSKKDDCKFCISIDKFKKKIIDLIGSEYIFFTDKIDDYLKMPNIIYLCLVSQPDEILDIKFLNPSSSLQILWLTDNTIRDFTPLKSLKSLKSLYITNTYLQRFNSIIIFEIVAKIVFDVKFY